MALSSQYTFIQPKEVIVLHYSDFVGSKTEGFFGEFREEFWKNVVNPKNPNPSNNQTSNSLDLNYNSPTLDGCLLVFFAANSIQADQIKAVFNSTNVMESGLGLKFGYVDLTAEKDIPNNILNTDEVRKKHGVLNPPFFILYNNRKMMGFYNPSVINAQQIQNDFVGSKGASN